MDRLKRLQDLTVVKHLQKLRTYFYYKREEGKLYEDDLILFNPE